MADASSQDAKSAAQALLGMSGLEAMRFLLAGNHPPPSIAITLGFTLAEVDDGRAVFLGDPTDRILNPLGIVHGGWALTLIDSCTGCAAHTTLPAGVGYTSVETKTNFVRAISPDTGQVRAEGVVLSRGRSIITTEGKLIDSRGRLLAHGTSTIMVLRKEGRSSQ
ncbi:PaaI family thioesterase [Candidatus Viadribacter manganicus]|uniref:Phenylacetic acid degradation protein n=1 Tax=Candidatus Viadribacter manganicus TaxID=1759059 RepID=A0A1B1AJG7_9PROT|nr:PaaI family thioesterase [Candidatus Viadribacter manganicus]ANP46695.1 phenylacetic acid degradation protein [Candidatus Viadribacter manganicus]